MINQDDWMILFSLIPEFQIGISVFDDPMESGVFMHSIVSNRVDDNDGKKGIISSVED